MNNYIKPTINLSVSGQINRIDFVKANTKPSINKDGIESLKIVGEHLQHKLDEIKKLIKITTFLSKHNISTFDEISNLECETTKSFLLHNNNDVFTILPINRLNELQEHTGNYELLKKDLAFKKIYQQSVLPATVNEWKRTIEEEAKNISIEEARIEYLKQSERDNKFKMFCENYKPSISLGIEEVYTLTLDNLQEPEDNVYILEKKRHELHYKNIINGLTIEQKYLKQALSILEDFINQRGEFKGLPTPNDLRVASIGTKKPLKWLDVDDIHKEKVKKLLKSTAPEILQKLEDEDNPNEIISHFIGIKLTKTELRILKTLRALVDRAFKLGEIQSYSHKVRIIRADFYKEYGLELLENGNGYHSDQTKKVREVLFSGTSNLTKRMFFNNSQNKTVLVTAFVMKIEWEEKNNYFEVMLDDIIFVKDKSDEYSYYYEDLQGLNRLLKKMPNSDAVFELHGYLEYALRENSHDFNTRTLLEQSGLIKTYNSKNPNKAINTLETILGNMVKVKTLISKWKLEKSFSDPNGKYILTNIRQKEISPAKSNKKLITKNCKNKKRYN